MEIRDELRAPEPPVAVSWADHGPQAVRAVLRPKLADVYFEASGPWPTDDVDHVHDVRVASRRLRAAIAVVKPLLGRAAADQARARVKSLGDALGARRAADVSLAWVGEAEAKVEDEDERTVLAQLRALLELRVRRTTARILSEHPAGALIADGLALLRLADRAAPDGPPLSVGIDAELRKRTQAVRVALPSMATPEDDEGHHAVRIALKRLRYTCEIASQAWPGRVPAEGVSALKSMQEALGDLHDQVELIAVLDTPRVRRGVPGVGVDALVGRLRDDRAEAYERARTAVDTHGVRLLATIQA